MARAVKSTKAIANQHETFEAIIPGTSQKLTTSGASAQSAAVSDKTTLVRLFATNDCYVKFGINPTALADGTCVFIPGGIVDFLGITPGDKIATIQFASGGFLFITEAE